MEQSRLMGPGYFYEIVFNRKEDPWMIHNSTVMYFPGEISPTKGHVFNESRRKLSEIYDSEIVIHHFNLIRSRITLLI